ncbi:hypothetical protein SERLA73DRAFT_68148 [Serpula lacrymans var. lacrymans S7.3]|uniref:Uncharacterized protein n=2 Tax=Serpula lacrymans var. lacrymans TaxID=341189 RepID=F8PH78_SERL3|nr:uncharacterized protein SERLADRAFT_431878 [Serpula lacrymans var. lacrymans S7.9]EGO04462.1 hypothetical protein SERLA73DRAFT_68148 [Serpula lacrymans var. lacrymans S7.3]EGO30346.1 hypothetical protein SERLADRAFT_431878 [Serpula lacrymans var. lacrymans S7.9]
MGVLPRNRVIIMITPLIALGDTQAAEMCSLNIKAVAVHSNSIQTACEEGHNLLDEIWQCQWLVSIWSPEKLHAAEANVALQDPT